MTASQEIAEWMVRAIVCGVAALAGALYGIQHERRRLFGSWLLHDVSCDKFSAPVEGGNAICERCGFRYKVHGIPEAREPKNGSAPLNLVPFEEPSKGVRGR